MDPLRVKPDFRSLSVRDLLEARELYHYHLMNKPNVIGTGIGLYLLREDESCSEPDAKREPRKKMETRYFHNSLVKDCSWPCVIVVVSDWMDEPKFGFDAPYRATDMVSRRLDLPNGKSVPVCVVAAEPGTPSPGALPDWHWPDTVLGGGIPLVVSTQGRERRATAGCLVTDGHTTYVLTSRHVSGQPGEEISALVRGSPVPIGRTSDKQIMRKPFEEVYPDLSAKRTFVNLDIGLIELSDVSDWTSTTYGIGNSGPLADVSEQNMTLQLINQPVIAHGAASGRLQGRIKCLFYRYKTVGGYEYVADFLIAPEPGAPVQTQPGDSGAVWHLVDPESGAPARPLAIEWGGQIFDASARPGGYHFALATSLSNVCKLLDVEIVSDHNTGALPYWGQTGHYSIASFACDKVQSKPLKDFMKQNIDRISFSFAELTPKEISQALKDAKENEGFVPLADVPDVVWKNTPNRITGGRDHSAGGGRTTGPEHPTHYADIDEKRPVDDKTLRDLSLSDPKNNLTVAFWKSFYDECEHRSFRDRGLLPFRVWQFFDEMVAAANDGDAARFLCAAGIVSHYVGDACQPLHGSIYADGYKDRPITVEHKHRDGTPYTEETHVGAGVHSAYESAMIDRHSEDLIKDIKEKVKLVAASDPVSGGAEVALAIVKLMDRSAKKIPPATLCDAFIDAGGKKTVAVYDALWNDFKSDTAEIMADGANVLAFVWDSAWKASGQGIPAAKLKKISRSALMKLYVDPEFVPSLDLDHIEGELSK